MRLVAGIRYLMITWPGMASAWMYVQFAAGGKADGNRHEHTRGGGEERNAARWMRTGRPPARWRRSPQSETQIG
jgi:hypothetical protein